MNQKAKPHIALVSSYYPPFLGGLERVSQEIAEQLVHDGYEVTVLTSDVGAKAMPRQEVKDQLIVKRLWAFDFAHVAFIPGLFWNLMRIPKPAIFHLHLAQVYTPEMVWLASKLRKIPYVVHFHLDVEPSGRFGFIFLWWKRWIQPIIIRSAARVVTLSPDQSDLIEKRYRVEKNKIRCMGNGVGEQFLKIGETSRVFHKPLRLIFVGRLSLQKRPERLVEAMSLVRSDVSLDIVGDGEDRPELVALASKLNLTNVKFCGRLDGVALREAYKEADVFVLPSDREGMPLVLLEAMATGLPIIGSDVLGITELIENVGILVGNPSPGTFAEAIDTLAPDAEKLSRLSVASFEKAKQHSWVLLVGKIEEMYSELVP